MEPIKNPKRTKTKNKESTTEPHLTISDELKNATSETSNVEPAPTTSSLVIPTLIGGGILCAIAYANWKSDPIKPLPPPPAPNQPTPPPSPEKTSDVKQRVF